MCVHAAVLLVPLIQTWIEVWQLDRDKSKWSFSSRVSHKNQSFFLQCSARLGCTSCRILSLYRRQCLFQCWISPWLELQSEKHQYELQNYTFSIAVMEWNPTSFWNMHVVAVYLFLTSTASCCMSSDMSAFFITAFRSDIFLWSTLKEKGEEQELFQKVC